MKFLLVAITAIAIVGCSRTGVSSMSGANVVSAGTVELNSSGLTSEQQNIKDRIQQDNRPGAIKHLYVLSAYSGQVIIYSTVKGKVTSSSKRLVPDDIKPYDDQTQHLITGPNGARYETNTLPGEDGAYGSSMPYLYWWDQRGVYHQHYVDGGQIVHISSEPMPVKSVIINLEQR